MQKLKNILMANCMIPDPLIYAGRGATLSNLNSNILEGLFKDIKGEYGNKAAKNFVKMVARIKVLSATTFLTELYKLHDNDWILKRNFEPIIEITQNYNNTIRIKETFLANRKVNPLKAKSRVNVYGEIIYY